MDEWKESIFSPFVTRMIFFFYLYVKIKHGSLPTNGNNSCTSEFSANSSIFIYLILPL